MGKLLMVIEVLRGENFGLCREGWVPSNRDTNRMRTKNKYRCKALISHSAALSSYFPFLLFHSSKIPLKSADL